MVIARFHWAKAGFVMVFVGLLFGMGFYTAHDEGWHSGFTWFFLFAGPIFILYFFSIFSALVFHGARAMWIENGQLIFVPFGLPASFTSYLYRVPVDDIASVTIARLYTGSFRPKGIVVDRKSSGFNRSYGEAPAQYYSEPVETVYARLCQAVGIAPEPAMAGKDR